MLVEDFGHKFEMVPNSMVVRFSPSTFSCLGTGI